MLVMDVFEMFTSWSRWHEIYILFSLW